MKSIAVVPLLALSLGAVSACASFPAPSERLAQAESGARAAREIGAANVPPAALHLKMAEDQVKEAKALMADGNNERASAVLLRAESDALLSLQLARESKARGDAGVVAAKVVKEGAPGGTP